MRIAMAQVNSIVGDLEGNLQKITTQIHKAQEQKSDMVAFPELAVTGYPPQDFLLDDVFVEENVKLLQGMIEENTTDPVAVVGYVDHEGESLYNAAAIFHHNKLLGIVHKSLLPTYDVFDEDRYFKPASSGEIGPIWVNGRGHGYGLGVEICEDLWDANYPIKVTDILSSRGAQIVVNISASPFYVGKTLDRMKLLKEKSRANNVPIVYVNMVGGQDELVFDGQSMAVDRHGELVAIGKQFAEDLVITDIDLETGVGERVAAPPYRKEGEMHDAIVLGIRDYFTKTGFQKAIVGMSGGIDSSLTTCIAVEALGKENVIGVSMSSQFSSDHSKTDAQRLAENLGIMFVQFSIQDVMDAYRENLDTPLREIRERFGLLKVNDDPVADENIQPRIRGNCLMDISNRLKDLGILVVNTGNKTELALGYCTLYGDMAGGIGALGDVSKLEVYNLARYVNEKAGNEIIPENVFLKKPSPELKDGQFDPFDFELVSPLVDDILEKGRNKHELIQIGYPREVVEDTYRRIRSAEYKRRQATPCIKVTPKAFGIGWKMPIVNRYRA